MKRPRGYGLAAHIFDILKYAPHPLMLSEIEAAMDFIYEPGEISSALSKFSKSGRVLVSVCTRSGPGRKTAKAYRMASETFGIYAEPDKHFQ